MKLKFLLGLFLFVAVFSNAQIVNIYVTNHLDDGDKITLVNYIDGLNKNLGKRYKGFSIMLHDYYNEYQTLIRNSTDVSSFFLEENKLFVSEKMFLNDLERKLNNDNSVLIPAEVGKMPSSERIVKDIQGLLEIVKTEFREARRNKEDLEVEVFFYNGYMLGKQDPQRLQMNLSNAQNRNDFTKLKPKFSWNGDKSFLPSGEMGNYVIQFDSIGYYDSYEIKITCLSKSAPGDLVNLVLKFDEINNGDYKLSYSGYNRSCKIEFSSEYLGTKCFGLTAGQYEISDEECPVCKEACLYGKAFQISILGICGDLKIEKLRAQTPSEYNITFQCKNLVK